MYKTINNTTSILRISDGACIPATVKNGDYVQYLQWLEEGNIPESCDGVPGITEAEAALLPSPEEYEIFFTPAMTADTSNLVNVEAISLN